MLAAAGDGGPVEEFVGRGEGGGRGSLAFGGGGGCHGVLRIGIWRAWGLMLVDAAEGNWGDVAGLLEYARYYSWVKWHGWVKEHLMRSRDWKYREGFGRAMESCLRRSAGDKVLSGSDIKIRLHFT